MASRSGKDTLEYMKVRKNFSCIIKSLQSIHAARQQMRTKFIEKGWLSLTSKPTEDELVTQALGRIEIDVTQFPVFITILREIQGMDQIVKKMTKGIQESTELHIHVHGFSVEGEGELEVGLFATPSTVVDVSRGGSKNDMRISHRVE